MHGTNNYKTLVYFECHMLFIKFLSVKCLPIVAVKAYVFTSDFGALLVGIGMPQFDILSFIF